MDHGPCVELRNVSVDFGGVQALDNVSLTVTAGERVALVGPSGAGKSTLLAVINTSRRATSGEISIFATDVSTAGAAQLRMVRRRIGTVYQGLHLPGTLRVIHNVNAGHLGVWSTRRALLSLARPRATDVANAALAKVGLADAAWRRTDDLSGGERQRVALARLLVQEPELIIADEPTSSLDPARADDVLRLLVELGAPKRTLVVSVHDVDLARRHCDRMVGLRSGRVVFDLPTAQVSDAHAAHLYDIESVR